MAAEAKLIYIRQMAETSRANVWFIHQLAAASS